MSPGPQSQTDEPERRGSYPMKFHLRLPRVRGESKGLDTPTANSSCSQRKAEGVCMRGAIWSRESNWPDRSRHQSDSKLVLKPDQLIQGSQKPGPSQLLRLSARRRFKKIRGNWRPLLSQSSITEHSNPARRRRFAGFPTSTHRLSACCIARDSS